MKKDVYKVKRKIVDILMRDFVLYTVGFILIVAIGYYPLWSQRLSVIWNIDGIGQYFPAFLYCGQYMKQFLIGILQGEFCLPTYDLSIALGEEIIGALNYYGFGDPINILSVFQTSQNASYLFTFSFFLRIWLAGLTFQLYCKEMKINQKSAILASFCYIFSGFAIYGGGRYVEWLSVLIYFPLMLVGTEKVLKEKKMLVLILSVMYGALCGFYFLYMSSLFMGIYWLIRLFVRNRGKYICIAKQMVELYLNYIVGLMFAAPIFLPSISAFLSSERNSGGIQNIIFSISNYIPHINWTFWNSLMDPIHNAKTEFSGIVFLEIFAVVVLFFIHNRASLQLKIAVISALVVIHLPITGWVFNGFGERNDRWFFGVHFLLAVVFAYILHELGNSHIFIDRPSIKIPSKNMLNGVMMICLFGNIVFNIWWLYSGLGLNWKTEMIPFDDVNAYVESPVSYSKVIAEDTSLYRVGNAQLTDINGRPDNIAMLNQYYGTTWWYSIINSNAQGYSDFVSQEKQNWRSFGFQDDIGFEAMAAVKYYLAPDGEMVSREYQMVEQFDFHNEKWNVYRNPYWQGFGYLVDEDIYEHMNSEDSGEYLSSIKEMLMQDPNMLDFHYDRINGTFHCTLDITENKEMVVFIPFSDYWKAEMDQEKVELTKSLAYFMSVNVPKGHHEIVFCYDEKPMKIGICLQLFGLLVLAGLKFVKKSDTLR